MSSHRRDAGTAKWATQGTGIRRPRPTKINIGSPVAPPEASTTASAWRAAATPRTGHFALPRPFLAGYTPSMKTAVSVPDDVFEEAERLAAELRTSRSQLYSRALREYVARHAPDRLTDAMNRVVDEVGSEVDEFSRRAARLVLERVEW
jgi:hypothetical protein